MILKKADFTQTTFGLSYMKDEDMDSEAYDQLVEHLCYTGAKIYLKVQTDDIMMIQIPMLLGFYIFPYDLKSDFGRLDK